MGLAVLIVALLMFSVSAVSADEGGEILILVGGMEGPDPDVYPVSETVTRWMQSIIGPQSNIELRLHDSVVPIEEFSSFYLEAYSAGAEEVVFGMYDIEGSSVSLRFAGITTSRYGPITNMEIQLDETSETIRFSIDLLNDHSPPPPMIRFFTRHMVASMYSDLGQPERALYEINYAIDDAATLSDEELSGLYSFRGLIQGRAFNDYDAALADFNTALELDSTNYKALSNRAYVLTLMGRYEEAFEDYNTKVETFPDTADAYSDRAGFLLDAGYLEEALSDYLIAIELAPYGL